MSKKDAVRQGALREHIGKIGTLPVITIVSKEPFKRGFSILGLWKHIGLYVEFLEKMKRS